jgi:hypothetical protein
MQPRRGNWIAFKMLAKPVGIVPVLSVQVSIGWAKYWGVKETRALSPVSPTLRGRFTCLLPCVLARLRVYASPRMPRIYDSRLSSSVRT